VRGGSKPQSFGMIALVCSPRRPNLGRLTYHHAIFGLAVGPEYSNALVADVFAMCR
jgi:hypothetical protein